MTLLMQKKFSLNVEFLQPLYIKLQAESDQNVADLNQELLPGYLPDASLQY